MDPYDNWDTLQKLEEPAPHEDLDAYLASYKAFDNVFNDALATLQDLDVPSGYGTPQSFKELPYKHLLRQTPLKSPPKSPYKHQKRPSGTAIFGYMDHTRELSITGIEQLREPESISPTQLRMPPNDHLEYNFSQPLEACKPIFLNEEDEDKKDDLVITNDSPQSYKFPSKRYVPIPVQEPKYNQLENPEAPLMMDVMNMNVFLPPPLSGSEYTLPEPVSPEYLLPLHTLVSPGERKGLQFGELYPQLLPLRSAQLLPLKEPESFDETVTDVNETIVQLTPLKPGVPLTPSKRIQLEWSPVISPGLTSKVDMRRAIQETSPKKVMKKTSLLPPGELDRYWEGPDEDKIFTCTYKGCGKKFTRRYNVRLHIQTHLSDRPFTCLYCPKSFVRQHDLNRHVKLHLVAKHCRCACGKEFTRIEGYKKHIDKGACVRGTGVNKAPRSSAEVLDGLTSQRLNDELGL